VNDKSLLPVDKHRVSAIAPAKPAKDGRLRLALKVIEAPPSI
jgi:hypothetical protein